MAVGALTVFLILGPVAVASSGQDTRPITLPREITLSGGDAFSRDVIIPRSATVSNPSAAGTGVRVRRGGRFTGIFLVELPIKRTGHVYVGGSRGTTKFFFELENLSTSVSNPTVEVHRGNYRLYYVPGTDRAQLSMIFNGLKGTTTMSAGATAYADVQTPEPIRPPPLYAAGGDGRLHGSGLLLGLTWLDGPLLGTTLVDYCQSKGRTPQSWMYLPGDEECSSSSGRGGAEGWIDPAPLTDSRSYFGAYVSDSSGGGVYQHSVAVETASPGVKVSSTFIWLTF